MALKIVFEAVSSDEAPRIVKEYVSSHKELLFPKLYPELSEANRREYLSKIITLPKNPTDWLCFYFCPNFPETNDRHPLFLLTYPKPEQGQPGHYFVKIYQEDEAKTFLANQSNL